MQPTLPQHDSGSERAQELAQAREVYRYAHDVLPPAALAAELPKREEPSQAWNLIAAEKSVVLAINSAKADGREQGYEKSAHNALHELIRSGAAGGMKGVLEQVNLLVREGQSQGRPRSLADYTELFAEIQQPAIASTYQEDRAFALQRVAGPNPLWIRRVSELPGHFPVREEHFQAGGGGDSLAAALAEGRAYLADYAVLEGARCGTFPAGQKYLCAPLALFVVPPAGARELRPVAIQCGQTPGPNTPIVTPRDGVAWLLAKTRVQTADGNCHQAISHLGHTHLPLEAFVLATHRQLSTRHPLYVLLHPHFEGTLSINESANASLLAPEGGVDTVMAGTIEVSRALAADAVHTWNFDAAAFPADLAGRGVEDRELLPDYPYRDDGQLIWDAIAEWVGAYVRTYYPDDASVLADSELQAWAAELCSEEGGRIRGFGQQGRLETRAYLIGALSSVIYTASAMHAAVNFPQFNNMSFVPNWPLAGFTPLGGAASDQAFLDLLPPLEVAHMQLSLGYLLGTLHYTKLGHYPHEKIFFQYFRDARVQGAAQTFRARLDAAEETIAARNAQRWTPYPHLLPSRIPQSINI